MLQLLRFIFPVAILSLLGFGIWKLYCYVRDNKLQKDRAGLLYKINLLKQHTNSLIRELNEYGIRNNAFHKDLLPGVKLARCITMLVEIREETVSDERVKHIKGECASEDIAGILAEVDAHTNKNLAIEKALQKAIGQQLL